MAEFRWDPDTYLSLMREELPDYERLQDEVAAAAAMDARQILELGTGTGETARRVLAVNPDAQLTGVDASEEMLSHARATLPTGRARLLVSRLEDLLPSGPFDLVVSVLAVHHLDAAGKKDLFQRISATLAPDGRFVLGDLVVPGDPRDEVTPIDGDYDTPSTIAEQIEWLVGAGLEPELAWRHRDLAVFVACRAELVVSRLV